MAIIKEFSDLFNTHSSLIYQLLSNSNLTWIRRSHNNHLVVERLSVLLKNKILDMDRLESQLESLIYQSN